jgi:tRNA pseudouridine55 synthase
MGLTGKVSQTPTARTVREKQKRRAVHGVILLDKPLNWSSNQALQKIKYLLRAEKAGHTGTLDPLATGLLPLCFGAAAKFSQINLEADKTYQAWVQLGIKTTTGDAEGEIIAQKAVVLSRDELETARQKLTGALRQKPPLYSALKKNGQPLYTYARAGIEIERDFRDIHVHRFDILDWQPNQNEVLIEVCVSKGTYIRTLAEDFGELLQCGAHLKALRRLRSGPISIDQSYSLEALMAMNEVALERCVLPPDVLIEDWPTIRLNAEDAGRFLCGLRRRINHSNQPHVKVYGPEPGALLGTAHVHGGELIPKRLLSPLEILEIQKWGGPSSQALFFST